MLKKSKKLQVEVNGQTKLKRFDEQNDLNKEINWEFLDETNDFNEYLIEDNLENKANLN